MSSYNNILVAIDLGEYSEDLIEKALSLASGPEQLQLVFVHQRMDSAYRGVGPIGSVLADVSSIEDRLREDLRKRLKGWADAYQIPEKNIHFLMGKPAHEIRRFAEEQGSDLIVIATHSRKGLQRLLGSTAHEVLQDARRDVLAVRIMD
jgi:universal stress protein A